MTMPNNPSTTTRPTSPILWVLAASIILNLFLIGVSASNLLCLTSHKRFALMGLTTSHSEQIIDRMIGTLDATDAAAFRDVIQPQADTLKQAHIQVDKAIKTAAKIYEQNPPDPVALQSTIEILGQTRADLNNVVGKILMDSYSKLSPDGRHRLAELKR